MPQMAPLMWSYLFILFIVSLVLFIMMNYFMKIYYPKSLTKPMILFSKPWKL